MNNDEKTTVVNEQTREWYPLWLDDEWYIRVDAEGRCTGKCGEGALGFIVQLSSNRDSKAVQALKIPRLVAETERENAYIGELLSQELSAVRDVFNQPGAKTGLVGARDTTGPFQKPLRIEQLEEALEWNGALLFVRFEKGQNPYFCLVKKDREQPYPPQALTPRITAALYDQIRNTSRTSLNTPEKQAKVWSQIVFVVQTPDETAETTAPPADMATVQQKKLLDIFNANSALSPEQASAQKTWYTCIPSVTYDWAPNTLQEAIGRGDRGGNWSIDGHLELVEQVCKGIKVLHNKGMLHADIRPANIVYLGSARDPSNYALSDYGSFAYSNAQPQQGNNQRSSDSTITGPVVEGERVSPFYAPERGAGRERETADMTIVVSPGSGPYCCVIVGWQSEFIELGLLDEVSTPKMNANEYMEFIAQRRNQYGNATFEHSLAPGDRVQLRDYVFELTAEEEVLGNILVFTCDQKFWTVYHGRIAIYENRSRQSCFAFPIPRIIELPQWSAATDIFSLGVLCLYSVYAELLTQPTVTLPNNSDQAATLTSDALTGTEADTKTEVSTLVTQVRFGNQKLEPIPTAQTNSKSSTVKLDEDFEVMLKYLADKSLFNAVWPQLEWLRKQIEDKLDEQQRQYWTAEQLANHAYEPKEELESVHRSQDTPVVVSVRAEKRTLQSETIKVISQITSTVPGIEHLLHPLSEQNAGAAEYQLGPFIFFLHFVLCCLHRQNSMDEKKLDWVKEGWMTAPFCEKRDDKPTNGAADKALERLMKIRSIIKAGGLKGLIAEKNKIAQFDLRPENAIRADNRRLKDEKEKWATVQNELVKKADELQQTLNEKTNELQQMQKDNEQYQELVQALEKSVHEAKDTQDALGEKTNKLQQMQKENEQYFQLVQALEKSFDEAIKVVKNASPTRLSFNRPDVISEMSTLFANARKANFVKRDTL